MPRGAKMGILSARTLDQGNIRVLTGRGVEPIAEAFRHGIRLSPGTCTT